jgi:hypothetical protein
MWDPISETRGPASLLAALNDLEYGAAPNNAAERLRQQSVRAAGLGAEAGIRDELAYSSARCTL